MSEGYAAVGNELEDRIFRLILEHPEILKIESVWGLFKVPGFKCDDLGPSLAQAGWALAHAQKRYRKKELNDELSKSAEENQEAKAN